jgi:hypothetical protein
VRYSLRRLWLRGISAGVILERYVIEIFVGTSISSDPHHHFFVESKFWYIWKLENGYDRIQLHIDEEFVISDRE